MKEFRKNEQGLFICEECNKKYVSKAGLSKHVGSKHDKKKYYDKWLKIEGDGTCKICSKETDFKNFGVGYVSYCSRECINKGRYIATCLGNEKLYGVKNPFQRKDIQEKCKLKHLENLGVEYPAQSKLVKNKIKKTNLNNHNGVFSSSTPECKNKVKQTKLKKYGNENYNNREKSNQTCIDKYRDKNYNNKEKAKKTNLEKYGVEQILHLPEVREKIKQTNLKRYGVENPFQAEDIKEKIKNTCLEKYGVEYSLQYEEVRQKSKNTKLEKYGDGNYNNPEKYKQTCLERYGVEHAMHNKEIFDKSQRKGFLSQYYKDTNIYYRGSYELDFLNKYHNKIDIENAPGIKYEYNGESKIYFPDFYISSLNLILEIKSLYYFEKYKDKCLAKEKATNANGFNFFMILDKNYKELNLFLKSL
jgi:hypothetical protein